MNVKLACTAVYGVFAPYTVGGHGILDIQRNSSCDPCPFPTLVSPLISTSNPRPIRIWWKSSCQNSKSDLPSSNYPFKKWIRLIRFRVLATRFPPDSDRAGIRGGDERGDEGGERTWITAGIPLYIQNSVVSNRIRSKNSVNGCTCQFHIHLLQYYT